MFALPVSGEVIELRDPDGADEIHIHEWRGGAAAGAISLLTRLCERIDWRAVVITDFEHALLWLRARQFGPRMALGFVCPHCRERAEVDFLVGDLQASITPRTPACVAHDRDRSGWYRAGDAGFRLITAEDQAVVAASPQPVRALAERCLDPAARRHQGRVERIMSAMAPALSRAIEGVCPACGAGVAAGLGVARVVMAEFRRAAAGVYEEIDLIARHYHWPEPAILALPNARRRAYAERIRRAEARAA